MVETGAVESDMGIGFAMIFSVITLGGAFAMLVGTQRIAAWGFAAAMLAASLAVVGAQAYW